MAMELMQHSQKNFLPGTDEQYCGKGGRSPTERNSAVGQEEQASGGQTGETAEARQPKTLDSGMKAQYLKRERPALGHLGAPKD